MGKLSTWLNLLLSTICYQRQLVTHWKWQTHITARWCWFHQCSRKQWWCTTTWTTLLWVHQTQWQKEMLAKYGNTITLLDASYHVWPCAIFCHSLNECRVHCCSRIPHSLWNKWTDQRSSEHLETVESTLATCVLYVWLFRSWNTCNWNSISMCHCVSVRLSQGAVLEEMVKEP